MKRRECYKRQQKWFVGTLCFRIPRLLYIVMEFTASNNGGRKLCYDGYWYTVKAKKALDSMGVCELKGVLLFKSSDNKFAGKCSVVVDYLWLVQATEIDQ